MEPNVPSPYLYQPLLAAPNSIRLLRLLPDTDKAEIRCEIFNYQLKAERSSGLYEALSYVWGNSPERKRLIIGGRNGAQAYLDVTTNLYAALRRLRDPDVERIVWVDAININQDDLEERGSQVQFMASIYSFASRVIVWLGEDDSGAAFELIREAADGHQRNADRGRISHDGDSGEVPSGPKAEELLGKSRKRKRKADASHVKGNEREMEAIDRNNGGALCVLKEEGTPYQAFEISKEPENGSHGRKFGELVTLLKLQWFRRIWVLQEVAAARSVLFIFGHEEITGGVFCRGLQALKQHYEHDTTMQGLVGSIIQLVDWHPVHAGIKHVPGISKSSRLNILPLPELIDMFHSHSATDRRDKVYALLGMSTDSFDTTLLDADYNKPWSTLFRDLVQTILGPQVELTVSDSMELAIIRVKGFPLGIVTSVENNIDSSGRQRIRVESDPFPPVSQPDQPTWNAHWAIHSTTNSIEKGDILCLLQGAQAPTIVRVHKDHCSIISAAIRPPKKVWAMNVNRRGSRYGPHDVDMIEWSKISQQITEFPRDFLLTWNWELIKQSNEMHTQSRQIVCEMSSKITSALDDVESELQRLLVTALLLEHMQDQVSLGRVLEHVAQLEVSSKAPPRLLAIFRKFRLVYRYWNSYVHLKESLYKLITPEKEMYSNDRSIVSYLQRRTQELDLVGVLSVLESRREEIARFSIAMMEPEPSFNTRSNSFDYSRAVYLIIRLLEGITVSEEDLIFAACHKAGRSMMEILIRYRPDDAHVLESTIKAAAGNAYSDVLSTIFYHCQDQVLITEEILVVAAESTSPKCFGIILKWPLASPPRITLAVVKEIAKNKHCGPALLELAFNYGLHQPPLTQEVLGIIAQNEDNGIKMLEVVFRKSKDIEIISRALEISASLTSNEHSPWSRLLVCYKEAQLLGYFEGKSYSGILETLYHLSRDMSIEEQENYEHGCPSSALSRDVENSGISTPGELILERAYRFYINMFLVEPSPC